jgi:hypothetical protein
MNRLYIGLVTLISRSHQSCEAWDWFQFAANAIIMKQGEPYNCKKVSTEKQAVLLFLSPILKNSFECL